MTAIGNRLLPFRSVTTLAMVLCSLMLCPGQQPARAQDDPQDLQGILPEYIPDGLSEGDFDRLGGNWAEWGDEAGRLVTDFYASDDVQVRGRRETLGQIQVRLRTMDKALSDPRYLPIYGPLSDLYGRLSRRMAVAAALLETVEQDVTRPSPSRLSSAMGRLDGDARSLRSYLQSINGGGPWIDYLQLNPIATAAGRVDASQETAALMDGVVQTLENREKYNEEQLAFLSREPVLHFADALGQVAQLLNVGNPEGRRQELHNAAVSMMKAIEDYEQEPTTETMQQVRRAYDDIRRLAPDGGVALTAAMRKHYFNFNLRVVVDESLAQELVRDTQMDSGFINEMVSRAHVTGCQWTNATVNLDLKPNNSGVRFDLILDGNVRSSVTGSTHLATVYTSGQYRFNGRKQVLFDGDHFATWPANVSVGGGNWPYAARTRLSWIPLVGRIAENAALNQAGSPENNQYARNKVYQEARSQFDRDAADMLRKAEQNLESDLTGPLRDGGYYPDVKQLRSTETQGILRSRLMESGEVGGADVLPLPIDPTHGALVQLHDSLLSQVGDRFHLEGRRFTPDELEAYLESEIEKITQKPVDLSGITNPGGEGTDSPKVESILFHDTDALRFRIGGGEVILYLNLGLKLEGREEIEPQRITVPLQFSLAGDKIHMERGTVGVSPLGRVDPADRAQQITRAGVMRQKIQEAFEPQDLDSSIDLSFEEKTLTLRVTDLRAHSGWLSLIATDGVSGPQSPVATTPSRPVQQVRLPHSLPSR